MIERYIGGEVPDPPTAAELDEADRRLIDSYDQAFGGMEVAMEAMSPTEALKAAWTFVRKANSYVEEVSPWALAKDEAQRRRLEVVLYNLAETLRLIALLTFPATPRAAQELWRRLGLDGELDRASFAVDGKWGVLAAGSKTTKGDALFPRLEDES
jgi:methionyl-tRNA synthetase